MTAKQMHENPVEILQRLIQFNTTNPPGHEAACVMYVRDLLTEAGIESTLLAKDPDRPNLIARLPGEGKAPPLLLYGHVDVVTAESQPWQQPPFEGKLIDGYVWGRGALDMKGGVAMMVAAFLRANAEGLRPPGDIVLAIVSDEEAGGDYGAKFLVEEHPDLFKDIKYAIGEFGGFTLAIGGKRFYPIMIAEKQICWIKATVRGQGGHGSMPVKGGATARLAAFLKALDENDLPVHVTPPAKMMVDAMASALGGAQGLILRQLTNPALTNVVLKTLGDRGRTFYPLFRNTVSPTILQGSTKVNVIPSEISVELDGRLLPGQTPEDMMRELRAIVGSDVELELLQFEPGPSEPDMSLFNKLAEILKEADPEGIPIPLLLSGVTDGRFFSQIGIQTYGYLPMTLPEDFNFANVIHAADERVPAAAIEFGARAIYTALSRFG
ncbi:MAG: M20/M25/M40 family metallo-hydrolase [Anaerolineales bacterium]|jgi:acetylornithine deacetylase/succinyl-diaminopimelate desuccinylase-like protein|uniref:M20/M25/M40 family metallo-hydrolase n=1 Tax=Candidatus Villigracilis vicinus TaxID=3140679 RepID=UPI003136C7A4|nr:M20/M25/M40 family metallo-hydrolase [Anaerolineales bacterium]MBK7451499.1 M20/M25/M40 family metallo-hydrolase [Anaerolineales bacterium]MBK9782276.1 M20/M25/M40 family metallo-hydrolase [Anaerolineales bacterium]